MASEESVHRQIERPRGIPGYRPAHWCAVCGRAADFERDLHCIETACPNLCHAGCLDDAPEYSCDNTPQLREQLGINDQVAFTSLNLRPPTRPDPPQQPHTPTDPDSLACGCGEVIARLRHELAATKEQIKDYREMLDELPDKRSVLVEALSIVDTLLTLRENDRDNFVQRSASCTARPDKIEKAWSEHIETNQEAREWWTTVCGGDNESIEVAESENIVSPETDSTPTHNTHTPLFYTTQRDLSPLPHPPSPHHPFPDNPEMTASPAPRDQQDNRQGERRGGYHSSQTVNPTQPSREQGHRRPWLRSAQGGDATRGDRERPRQTTTTQRHHKGRFENQQRKRLTCEYCQGRYHTAQNCRERQADRRHQDLIEAVRLGSQETLAVLRGVTCQPSTQAHNTPWQASYLQPQHVLGAGYTPMTSQFGHTYPLHQHYASTRTF